MKKKIQILLRENVAAEKELIDYLESIGERTGEPKRLLLEGFSKKGIAVEPKKEEEEKPEVQNFGLNVRML